MLVSKQTSRLSTNLVDSWNELCKRQFYREKISENTVLKLNLEFPHFTFNAYAMQAVKATTTNDSPT